MRRTALFAFLALALLAELLFAQLAEPGPSLPLDPPDLLVVVLDDVGEWDLEQVEVPNIDALAAAGCSFVRANTTSSVCSPSRTVLTGEWGRRNGIGAIVKPIEPFDLDEGVETLADRLKAKGYSTGAFGKWHLSEQSVVNPPAQFGFDAALAIATHNLFLPLSDGSGTGNYTKWDRYDDGALSIETEYATAAQVQACIDWWQATEGPKFAWLALSAAHGPFHIPPAEFLPVPPPTGHSVTLRERFELMLQAADNRIGYLVAELDLEHAYLVLWSDNGTPENVAGGQDPSKVKGSMFEGGVGTPLIVVGPTVNPGIRRRLVSALDIHDTLLELAGAAGGTEDSVSFASDLGPFAGEAAREWTFAEWYEPNGFGTPDAHELMVRTKAGWKLVLEEMGGIEISSALYQLPDESTVIVDAAKEAELRLILAGI